MEENLLPPGFRFHPTDEEIITYYLTRKVYDISFTSKAIVDVDLNKCEPWDLPAKASMGEKEWYFFNLRDRKYPTGLRTNRATDSGYWKTTGKDKEIFHGDGVLVGMKKTLVFYKGRAPKGVKSNWVMHEYRVQNKYPFKSSQEEWVVCRVFQKRTSAVKKPQQAPPSQPYDDQESPCDTNSIVNEFGDIELPNLNSIANLTTGFDNNVNNNSMNMTNNMNLNMNWTAAAAATIPSLTWPSSLLSPNLSMNSLLLKALQLKNYQAREATSSDQHSFLQQQDGINSQFESDLISSNFQASSSKVLDSVPREQPFNVDSIW